MSIFVLSAQSKGAELSVQKQDDTFKFKITEDGNNEYLRLSDTLKPLSVKPTYNRALHKISFIFNKNVFLMSPISNAVSVNGAIQIFGKPIIVKQGVAYISKEAFVYFSPFLSYSVIRKLIVIDPGHGGDGDDGLGAKVKLQGKDIYEKQITLNFAEALGLALERMGYKIIYTRTEDKKIPLSERTKSANTDGAKAFISLHANSSSDTAVNGADVFYMSEDAEDSYSQTVAAQENLLLGGKKAEKDVGDILKSMMVSGHIKESARLAYAITVSLSSDISKRGVKKAPFAVLHSAYMPSVLVELGFMTNDADLKKMTNDKWIKDTSYDLAKGIDSYFRKNKEE